MLREAFGHHVWATDRLLETCASLSDEQLHREMDAVYGSILETLGHLVDADNGYVRWLSAERLGRSEITFDGPSSLEEVRELARTNAEAWTVLVATGVGDDLAADVVHTRKDGSIRHATVGIRLAQVVHHGTDHRSQICTALTLLGVEPPDLDVWAYGEAIGASSTSR